MTRTGQPGNLCSLVSDLQRPAQRSSTYATRPEQKAVSLKKLLTCSFLLLLLQIAGCSQIPSGEVTASSRQSFILYHLKQAQELIDAGHYHQALTHINILQLADPENSLYDKNYKDVKQLAIHDKEKLLENSKTAYQQGQTDKWRHLILQALSITPNDPELITKLRKWSTHQLRQEQAKKQAKYAGFKTKKNAPNTNEQTRKSDYKESSPDPLANYRELIKQGRYQALIEAFEQSQPVEVPVELEGWLMQSHLGLALELEKQKKTEASLEHAEQAAAYNATNHLTNKVKDIKKELSVVFLERSKGLIRDDIDKALRLLELANSYDETNNQISMELIKVQRIKNNLERIKAQN